MREYPYGRRRLRIGKRVLVAHEHDEMMFLRLNAQLTNEPVVLAGNRLDLDSVGVARRTCHDDVDALLVAEREVGL